MKSNDKNKKEVHLSDHFSPPSNSLDGEDKLSVSNRDIAKKRHIKPSLLQMAINLLGTAMSAAKTDGKPLVSEVEQEIRFNICLECDELWLPEKGEGGARCCECGCFIQPKTALRASDCPLSQWPSV